MGDGHVEGCFDRFDALSEIPQEPNLIGLHNNRRCQAACGAQGYALAATRSDPPGCLCGNDYPSAFHQVMWRPGHVSQLFLLFCFALKFPYSFPHPFRWTPASAMLLVTQTMPRACLRHAAVAGTANSSP